MTATALPADVEGLLSKTLRDRAQQRAVAEAADEMRAALDVGILLGGRMWKPPRVLTFELERLRVDVVRRSGIAGLFPLFKNANDRADELTALVLQTAFANNALYDLLAHLLVEDGVDYLPWSKSAAAERAGFFATLVDPADHQRIESTILMLVLDFFLSASASMPISLRSTVLEGMASARAVLASQIDHPPNTPTDSDDQPSAATMTSDDGTPSSAPSRASEASTC